MAPLSGPSPPIPENPLLQAALSWGQGYADTTNMFNLVASHDQTIKAIYESRVKAAKISAQWNELILTTMDRMRAFRPEEAVHEEELEDVYACVVSLTTKEALYRKIELLLQGGNDVVTAEGGEQERQWYCVDLSKNSFGLVTQCAEGCRHTFQASPDIERVHFLVRLGEHRGGFE